MPDNGGYMFLRGMAMAVASPRTSWAVGTLRIVTAERICSDMDVTAKLVVESGG
jgi:hypothetical protein